MKSTRHLSYFTFIFASLLLVFSSCRSTKTIGSAGELTSKNKTELVNDVLSNNIDYKTISGKINLELKSGKKSQKVGAQVKIIKDEVIQISVRPGILGFSVEVFRITITPESVVVLDRMKQRYISEDIKSIQEKVHFNFYNIQALLTNSLFIPEQKTVSTKDVEKFSVTKTKDVYMLGLVNNKTTYNFAVDAADRIVSTLIFDQNKNTVQWTYDKFTQSGSYIYPTQMLAQIEIKDKRLDVGFELPSLKFNEEVNVDYSISESYQKVSIAQILDILSQLK